MNRPTVHTVELYPGAPERHEVVLLRDYEALHRKLDNAQQAAPVDVPDEREAFEQWIDSYGWPIQRRSDGDTRYYEDPTTQLGWEAWKARALLAAAPTQPAQQPVAEVVPQLVDDGYLVPKHAKLILDIPVETKLYAAPPAPEHPANAHLEWVGQVMTQAQVFASAWSLVGGRFDAGDGLKHAEEEKRRLREMLEAGQ
ncbi:hypothetical protein SAMN04244574_00692 [Azotobacter beijerinckii]|uniref:Uncharacterized protein n=1 Tax=Azotobacter beijerinckii TaxID=170623 RepID=A0A1I3ZQA8_9GAMM|nr:hypothetical protein SAMN04244574_00692 [Azotobacter beijerinckii]